MGQIDPQKRIDFAFMREGYRQCRRIFRRAQSRLNIGIFRFDKFGKTQIGGGIFMRRIKQRFFGQLIESLETVVQIFYRTRKHPATAGGE